MKVKIDSPLKSIALCADYAVQVVSSVTSYGVTTITTNNDRKMETKMVNSENLYQITQVIHRVIAKFYLWIIIEINV